MTTYYLDPVNGNNGNDGLSFANRKLTLGNFTLSAGDTVRVIKSTDPTSLGVTASWTNLSDTITLTTAVNKTVTNCESNWTASANVTCSTSGTVRQGSNSQSVAIAAGFTTGKAAYFTITSADFSAYQQICLWVRPDSSVSANTLRISLCSDTTGDTQVDNFDIDFALSANRWYPVVIDKGSALGASIQSVALYCQSDPGTVTVLLDNIFVAKAPSSADSLTLNSLISKNTGNETWWAIKSISGATDTSSPVTVKLDYNPGTAATPEGYYGTSETVTTYKRETVKPTITTGSSQSVPNSGSAGNLITISGGWDTTNMSSQTGETWLDGRTGQGTGWDGNSKNYIDWDKVACTRYDTGFNITGTNNTGGVWGANNCNTYGVFVSGSGTYLNDGILGAVSCNSYGLYLSGGTFYAANAYQLNGTSSNGLTATGCKVIRIPGVLQCNGNGNLGISLSSGVGLFDFGTTTTNNNSSNGFFTSHSGVGTIDSLTSSTNAINGLVCSSNAGSLRIYSYTTTGNGTRSISFAPAGKNDLYLWNASIAEGTVALLSTTYADARIYSQHEGGTFNNNIIRTDDATISYDTTDPHTGGGGCWKVAVTGTSRTSVYPLRFSIAKVAVAASSAVTFNVWAKKSHASDISATLVCPGGQISGVSSDVTQTISATSYTQYTLNFTPSQAGVVEIFVDVWSDTGSTTQSIRVADISVTQA